MMLISVLKGAKLLGVSTQRAYELIRLEIIPAGVAVKLGRQIRIDEEGLANWIRAGGQALPGGWRREPES